MLFALAGIAAPLVTSWLALVGYVIAAPLITATYLFVWTAALSPIWVLVLSLEILVVDFRRTRAAAHESAPG